MIIATTKERILQFIDYKHITEKIFLEKTGLKRGLLDKDKLKSTVNDVFIAKIIAAFPELNVEWLITGKDEMLKKPVPTVKKIDLIGQDGKGVPGSIPLIPIDAMAGYGEGETRVMDYDAEYYVIPEFNRLKVDFMIRVKGDSMQPHYNGGDIVACRKLSLKDIFFQWNRVYVLDTDQGALIKRVREGADDEHILIVSDNPAYTPFSLNLSQVYAISLVMGSIRFE